MSDVTSGFGSYDLSEIAEEYRNQADEKDKNVDLPEKVGGSRVHLLLEIKNTNLDPVLIKVLSSGIAVYLSPFKDIYSSRIIFGGPHRSFTKSDNGLKTEMSNAVFFLNAQVPNQQQLRDDPGTPEVDLIDFSIVAADAGKGVAEELLTDLEVNPAELKVAEKPLIDLEMDSVRLERFRFQLCLNKAGYLETLEQKPLMDMDLAEKDEDIMNLEICKLRNGTDLRISDNLDDLNETKGDDLELAQGLERFRFQSCLNKAGYLETLEQKSFMDMNFAEGDEDIMKLEICKLRDGSDLRISNNLDDLNETKGDVL